MFLRHLSAALVGCILLTAPIAATAAGRGPSTPEERARALAFFPRFEADPLNTNLIDEREWALRWIIEIPDVHVDLCMILDKLPKPGKKDSSTLFLAMSFAQAAFVLQHPEKQENLLAQHQAGVEGVLRVYEVLLKANPKDQQPYLDDLIKKREAGTLAQWVKERADTACKK